MQSQKSRWLPISIALCVLVLGLPYWQIPYNKLSLPNALLTPGLALVFASALLLRLCSISRFWRVTLWIGSTAVLVVVARVVVDGLRNPTSHNLWPLEVMIAAAIGVGAAGVGAVIGSIAARWMPHRYDKRILSEHIGRVHDQ